MNVQRLVRVFHQAGLNVRLGTLDESVKEPTRIDLPDGTDLTVEPLVRQRGRLGLKDFDPCTILLNNDLSAGVPRVLQHLHEQYLLPPLHAGRATRRKSLHSQSYEEVAKKFAKLLGMDPWLINPMVATSGAVNWADGSGFDALQAQADALLGKVRRKYKEYGINEKPFVVVKADNGGPGLGILTVRDAKDLDAIAARLRTKPAVDDTLARNTTPLLLQEGVPSYERMNDAVAEPVVYMIDRYVVGGFYRVHAERGIDENLNAPGSSFVPLAFAGGNQLPRLGEKPGASAPNRFYMYGVIGRLAMLAASYELEATDPDAEVYE